MKKTINKVYLFDEELKQITINDKRFYERRKGEYYPSVSFILKYNYKGEHFDNWLKDTGHNSDFITQKAAEEGSVVHKAIEDLLKNNKKLILVNDNGYMNYSILVWEMILKFKSFWNKTKPKLLYSEILTLSDKYKYAGTADLIVEIENENWLIDIKTSNNIQNNYYYQLAAYRNSLNENNIKIDRAGILWLKSKTRKDSKDKIQGKGWALLESENGYNNDFNSFLTIYDLFKLNNKEKEPEIYKFPNEISLN